jgi:hypothetical protein
MGLTGLGREGDAQTGPRALGRGPWAQTIGAGRASPRALVIDVISMTPPLVGWRDLAPSGEAFTALCSSPCRACSMRSTSMGRHILRDFRIRLIPFNDLL